MTLSQQVKRCAQNLPKKSAHSTPTNLSDSQTLGLQLKDATMLSFKGERINWVTTSLPYSTTLNCVANSATPHRNGVQPCGNSGRVYRKRQEEEKLPPPREAWKRTCGKCTGFETRNVCGHRAWKYHPYGERSPNCDFFIDCDSTKSAGSLTVLSRFVVLLQ